MAGKGILTAMNVHIGEKLASVLGYKAFCEARRCFRVGEVFWHGKATINYPRVKASEVGVRVKVSEVQRVGARVKASEVQRVGANLEQKEV